MSDNNSNSGSGVPWGAIASGVASLAGNMWSTSKNNESIGNMNDVNIQHQWDMWNANNEYNLPTNARKRMEAAGYNANTLFGRGQMAGGSSPMNPPDMKANHYPDVISPSIASYQDFRMKDVQSELLTKQLDAVQAETDLKKVRTFREGLQAEGNKLSNSLAEKGMQYTLDGMAADAYNKQVQGKMNDVNLQFLPLQKRLDVYEQRERINHVQEMAKQARSATDLNKAREALESLEMQIRREGGNPNDPWYVREIKRTWKFIEDNAPFIKGY